MDIIFWSGMPGRLMRTIGCYQLSHWLRKHGYECQVIDFIRHMSLAQLIDYTEKFISNETICIGISSTFWTSFKDNKWHRRDNAPDLVLDALKHLKKKYPRIKFVLGGSQVDHQDKDTIQLFDFVVSGAGEDALLDFLNDVRKNKKYTFSLETRYGTPYKSGSLNNQFNISENDHVFVDQDCIIDGEALPIEISRGCIFKCSFCQYPYIGKKKFDYIRGIDYIRQELEHNYKYFKTTNYYILDDTFNDSKEKIDPWFDCLNSLDFKINYTGYMRADLLSRNEYQIEKFKDTGLATVFFGLESMHPDTSRKVGKAWAGKEAKEFLPRLKSIWGDKVGIHLNFIVGFPDDSEEYYREVQDWCYKNKFASWTWQPLYINPDADRLFTSDLDRNPEKHGFKIDENRNWYNERYTADEAYHLSLKLSYERNKLHCQKITQWEMIYWMSMGFSKEYLENTYIYQINFGDNEVKFLAKYLDKLNSL